MEYKLTFKEYCEALKNDKLLALKCKKCGTLILPPKMACQECLSSDMGIIELKGKGTIQTFTTMFVAPEGRETECPYIVVMVELDEGPWVMGNLTGIDPKEASMELIGKRVRMGHKIFSGDKYSGGEAAVPLFSLEP